MTKYESKKKGCLLSIGLFIFAVICFWIGTEYDIYVLKTFGYMFPVYSGTIYAQYAVKGNNKRWNIKKHIIYIISLFIIAIVFTLIANGKLW